MKLKRKMFQCLIFFLLSLQFGKCRLPDIRDVRILSFRSLIGDTRNRIRSINTESVYLGRYRTLDKRQHTLPTPLNIENEPTNNSGEINVNLSILTDEPAEVLPQLPPSTYKTHRQRSRTIPNSAWRSSRFEANMRRVNFKELSNLSFRDLSKETSIQNNFKGNEMRLNGNPNRKQRNNNRGMENRLKVHEREYQFKGQERSRTDSVLRERGNAKQLSNRRTEIPVKDLLKIDAPDNLMRTTRNVLREHNSKRLSNRRTEIPMKDLFKADASILTMRTTPRKSVRISRRASAQYFSECHGRRSIKDAKTEERRFYLKSKHGARGLSKSNPVLPSTERDMMTNAARFRQERNSLVSRRELKIPAEERGLRNTRTDRRNTRTYETQSRNVEETLRSKRSDRGSRRRYRTKENSRIQWKFVENNDKEFRHNKRQLFIKQKKNADSSETSRRDLVLSRNIFLVKYERGNNRYMSSSYERDSNWSVRRIRHSGNQRNNQNRNEMILKKSDEIIGSRIQSERSSRLNARIENVLSRNYEQTRSRYNLEQARSRINLELARSRINLEQIRTRINLEQVRSRINMEYIRSQINIERIRSRINVDHIRSRINIEQIRSRINPDKTRSRIIVEQTRSRINTEQFRDSRLRQVNFRGDRLSIERKQILDISTARSTRNDQMGGRFRSTPDFRNERIQTILLSTRVRMQQSNEKDRSLFNRRDINEHRRMVIDKSRNSRIEDQLIERRLENIRNDQYEGNRRIRSNQRRISASAENKESYGLFEIRMNQMKDQINVNRRNLSSRRRIISDLRNNVIGGILEKRSNDRVTENRRVVSNQRRVIVESSANSRIERQLFETRRYNRGQNLVRSREIELSYGRKSDIAGRSTMSWLSKNIPRDSFTTVKQRIDAETRTPASLRGSRIRREVTTKSIETQERRLVTSTRLDRIHKSFIPSATESTNRKESHRRILSSRGSIITARKSDPTNRSSVLTERSLREQRNSVASHSSTSSKEATWSLSEILIPKRSTITSFVLNSLLGLAIIAATADDTSKGVLSRGRAQFVDHMSRLMISL